MASRLSLDKPAGVMEQNRANDKKISQELYREVSDLGFLPSWSLKPDLSEDEALARSPLGRLPAELRIIVYKLLLCSPTAVEQYCGRMPENWKPYVEWVKAKKDHLPHVGILMTCHKLYREAVPILYGLNEFEFIISKEEYADNSLWCQKIAHEQEIASLDFFTDWLEKLGDDAASALANVRIALPELCRCHDPIPGQPSTDIFRFLRDARRIPGCEVSFFYKEGGKHNYHPLSRQPCPMYGAENMTKVVAALRVEFKDGISGWFAYWKWSEGNWTQRFELTESGDIRRIKNSTLTDLPRPLLNKILKLVFGDPLEIVVNPPAGCRRQLEIGLLGVCRSLRTYASRIFYSSNTFVLRGKLPDKWNPLDHLSIVRRWLLTSRCRHDCVTHVRLELQLPEDYCLYDIRPDFGPLLTKTGGMWLALSQIRFDICLISKHTQHCATLVDIRGAFKRLLYRINEEDLDKAKEQVTVWFDGYAKPAAVTLCEHPRMSSKRGVECFLAVEALKDEGLVFEHEISKKVDWEKQLHCRGIGMNGF